MKAPKRPLIRRAVRQLHRLSVNSLTKRYERRGVLKPVDLSNLGIGSFKIGKNSWDFRRAVKPLRDNRLKWTQHANPAIRRTAQTAFKIMPWQSHETALRLVAMKKRKKA